MADLAELKEMVMSFRLSELHVLLGFAGRNKSGRKQELTQRALSLVQKGCSLPVQIKIRELYRQINAAAAKSQNSPPLTDVDIPAMHRHPVGLDYSAVNAMRTLLPQPPPIPVNPDVRLKHLPFYDVLAEIMKPTSLIPKNTGRMQETLFVFHLTPQQAQDITMSRDFRPGAKNEYTVQVQLRFCLLETTCEQADTFPSQIQVRVNNKPAQLPPKPLPLHNKAPPKKYGSPIDITPLCRLSPSHPNNIIVSWFPETHLSFCMAVYLVRKLSSDTLLTRLKQFGNRHSDHTKALIKEKLVQDPDSEIATTSLRVSLMCPLGKMRIQIPCRASTCTHLQCFDAATYLMMNERKPTWMCPVCDRPCPYDKLIIDGYFVEICRQSPLCIDIIFHEDGSWTPMKPQKENNNQVILTNTSKAAQALSMSASSSSSSSLSCSSVSVTMTAASLPTAPKPAPAKGPVIDLTLDSSDEDDDAVISSDSINSPPVINLDTPSPAPVLTVPGSPLLASVPSSLGSHHNPHQIIQSNHSYSAPSSSHPSSNHSGSRDSPLSAVDSILQSTSSIGRASPNPLQSQTLNLEAMSDADFDEFLKGLSWGV